MLGGNDVCRDSRSPTCPPTRRSRRLPSGMATLARAHRSNATVQWSASRHQATVDIGKEHTVLGITNCEVLWATNRSRVSLRLDALALQTAMPTGCTSSRNVGYNTSQTGDAGARRRQLRVQSPTPTRTASFVENEISTSTVSILLAWARTLSREIWNQGTVQGLPGRELSLSARVRPSRRSPSRRPSHSARSAGAAALGRIERHGRLLRRLSLTSAAAVRRPPRSRF